MMYIGINLTQVKDAYGKTKCVAPVVEMGIDVDDNFDLEKLKDFKRGLENYLEKLNDCLTHEKETDASASGFIHGEG